MKQVLLVVGVAACLAITLPSIGLAALRAEGTPEMAINIQPIRPSGTAGQTFGILCSVSGFYSTSVVANAVIRLGSNLEWIAGDSVHVASVSYRGDVSGKDRWNVDVRVVADGVTEIRGTISVSPQPNRVDEREVVLPVLVTKGVVTFGQQRRVRAETVRGGQRYRYGGEFLVPIDRSEAVTGPDIQEGVKVTRKVDAICRACAPDSIQELQFVVFVNRDGSVHSSRLLGEGSSGKGVVPAMVDAAKETLTQWRFTPSRTKSGPVADWTIVAVRVRGKRSPR